MVFSGLVELSFYLLSSICLSLFQWRKVQRSMSKVAIAIQKLTKTFSVGKVLRALQRNPPRKGETEVLKGISLEVYQGEVLGLLGPNGAGKTTLLEILSTLLLPTSGEATICGYDVVREAGQVRKVVSYCPSALGKFLSALDGNGKSGVFCAAE